MKGERTSKLKIFLLGPFAVWRSDRPVNPDSWRNEKTKTLFKILLSEPGRVFTPDELIEWLWPDSDPKSAASNLRTRIAELRRFLEPQLQQAHSSQFVQTRPQGYSFNPTEECWLDTGEFKELFQSAKREETAGQMEKAIQSYERALQLYRGDFASEDRFDDWAMTPRTQFREYFLELLARVAECHAQLGQYRRAIARCRQILTYQPTRESVYAQLMTYSYLAGDQAAALQVFEECERVLREHLSTLPSAQIKELHDQILERHLPGIDEKYRPVAVATQPVPYSLGRTPFVGRARELSVLLNLLKQALAKQGSVTLLAGEAGIGKSRLAQEVIAHAREASAIILQGRCPELSIQLPFQPIVQALRLALPDLPKAIFAQIPTFWLSELAKLLPELPSVSEMKLPPSVTLPPEQERMRLFEALTQFYISMAQSSPLLLIYIDDMQWADATSLDYFNLFVPRLTQESIFILGAYRTEEVAPSQPLINPTRDVQGRELVHKLEVGRLSASEITELMQRLAPSVDRRLIERLYLETEGNPFYLISVIQGFFEEGVMHVTPDKSWMTEIDDITQNYQELLIPSQVKDVIARRVQALGDEERELLQLVAVIGHTVEYRVLQEGWDDTETLRRAMDKLLERHILHPRMGSQFEFSHDKIRQFVYSSLSEPHRQALHGRIGASVEKTYATRLHDFYDVLAHHYALDTAPKKAFEYTLKTLDRARHLYQNEEALRLVERGLALAGQVSPQEPQEAQRMRFELLQRRADLLFLMGRSTQLESDIQELWQLGEALHDRTRLAEAHFQRARFYMSTTRYQLALTEARQGYDLLHASQENPELLGKHLLNLGAIYFYMNDYGQALRHYEEALQMARTYADVSREANALHAIALIYARTGNLEQALEQHGEALQLYRKMRHRKGECNALTAIGNLHFQLGRPREALADYVLAYPISLDIGDRREQANVLTNQGNAALRLGAYADALRHYQAAYSLRETLNDRRNQAGLLNNLGTVYYQLGQWAQAKAKYELARKLWEELGNRTGLAMVFLNLGELLSQQSDPKAALTLYQEACVIYEEFSDAAGYAVALYEISRAHSKTNNVSAASEASDRSLTLATQAGAIELQIKNHSLRATLALAQGQLDQALQSSERALELMREETLMEHPHQIYFQHSRVLKAVGQEAAAKIFLQRSLKIVQERAYQLQDETLRTSYLENVPLNAEILQASKEQKL